MVKISSCKLSINSQKKLLEFFVLEVTSRSAANLLEIYPSTGALFYKEVRQVKWLFVLGILKRQGKVYTVVVPDTKANTLMPIFSSKIKVNSIVYIDSWRLYNALDVSRF